MAAKYHRHIALTDPLARFVERRIAEGHYASASEVVAAGLRLRIGRAEAGAHPAEEEGRSHG